MMKQRSSHQQSISKSKYQKQNSKSRHGDSVSNIKHRTSLALVPTIHKKSMMKTKTSCDKSKGKTEKPKVSQIDSKQNKSKTNIKRSQNITHVQSKDKVLSNNTTERRRQSIKVCHKTQINDCEVDLVTKIEEITQNIYILALPKNGIEQYRAYFQRILAIIGEHQDPFHIMLRTLHSAFSAVMQTLLSQIEPYQNLLLQKQSLSQQIQIQSYLNKKLLQDVSFNNEKLQIQQLEALIQDQRRQIEEKKRFFRQQQIKERISYYDFEKTQIKRNEFKINLEWIKDNTHKEYHNEFQNQISKISQCLRNQAGREKLY